LNDLIGFLISENPGSTAVHDITEDFADPPEEPGFRRLPTR